MTTSGGLRRLSLGFLGMASLLALCGCPKPLVGTETTPDTTPDSGPAADSGTTLSPVCAAYAPSRKVGENTSDLPELSGLVASRRHPGIFWAHNDSGNPLELYAIRESGGVAAKIPLTGASNIDVEDIAVAPCGSEFCVLLADIGDNAQARTQVMIYRLKEPDLTNDARAVEVLAFNYPDGAHNAESFVVDPATGTPYVITKELGTLGNVYKLSGLAPGATGSSTKIATLPGNKDQISTGADAHPSALRVLIRTYSHLWELRQESGTFDGLFSAEPVEVPSASMVQSEAVAYRADGRGYLLGTEGVGEAILAVDCRE